MKRCAASSLWLAVLLSWAASASAENPAGAPADWPLAMHGSGLQSYFIAEQLEYRANEGDDAWRWEVAGWLGDDRNKLWLESEGEWNTGSESRGEAEVQALYGRMLSGFWDLRAGLRQDFLFGRGSERERSFGVLDIHGLAPLWLETTLALFVSDDGDVSARLTLDSDWLLTQRWVLMPRVEWDVAFHDARRFGVRRGPGELELGLRLRYEIRREFAPYVGVHWERRFGASADLARDEGDPTQRVGAVAGLRLWF